MAYISYINLWESEHDNIFSKRDKLQDMNINQLKLEVYDLKEKMKKRESTLNLVMSKCYKQSLPR